MIVSAGIAATARARALTGDKVERLREAWGQRPASDPLRRVDDLIGDISQGVFFAGLLRGIEHEIWRMCDDTILRGLDTGTLSGAELRAMLAELKALTIDQGWWFAYDLDSTPLGSLVARQVPLAEWETNRPKWNREPFVISFERGR